MVRTYDCSFCGKEIEPGTGSMQVSKDHNVLRFDSRKCKRSHEMHRDPRKIKWTTKYQKKIIIVEEAIADKKGKAKKEKAPAESKPKSTSKAKSTKKESKE